MNKTEWLKTTAGYRYLSSKNIEFYYGIAYLQVATGQAGRDGNL